ncbi:hypothetical protein CC2G_009970 [Coprinopsis cinerea AmutBmut pab1-1]|nr:hypothetical protein CC2G_009970 [Coprinopsis cinerea AmutBmut pab1-1]
MALTAAGTTKVDLEEAENASIDRRILALETELRKLKREKNDRAKVSRLPDEVLCAIFLFLAEDMKASHRMGRITWVCQRWRNAALRLPFLWTHLTDLCHRAGSRSWFRGRKWHHLPSAYIPSTEKG